VLVTAFAIARRRWRRQMVATGLLGVVVDLYGLWRLFVGDQGVSLPVLRWRL
jgi:hypothetical protein